MKYIAALYAVLSVAAPATHSIDKYVQTNLKDASFTVRILSANFSELNKIGNDFGNVYRIERKKVQARDPYMLRVSASINDVPITYIINGAKQAYIIPRIHLHKTVDLADEPGKRQSWLDFGLLTPSLFSQLFAADFVRIDRATNEPVFDLRYRPENVDTTRMRIWIDPVRHIVTRREWYAQDGRLKAVFIYDQPKDVDGVYVPTRLTVMAADGRVAGVAEYGSIRINTGLLAGLFRTG